MLKPATVLSLILFLFATTTTTARVHPAHKASVHYRLAGFEVDAVKGVATYELEVFDANDTTRPLISIRNNSHKIIATLPSFGRDYLWRMNYLKGMEITGRTPMYQLNVKSNPYADTVAMQFNIIQPATAHKDLLVFTDCNRSLYNLNGESLWFVPDIPGLSADRNAIRDIKLTDRNTITMISNKYACEIDYDGNVLWKAPNNGKVSGDKDEHYHHEFTRLANGHYMISGNKTVARKLPPFAAKKFATAKGVYKKDDSYYTNLEAGTLIEYDSAGNIVWQWLCSDHFTDKDLFTPQSDGTMLTATHLNGFYKDEANKVIYISYRDVSRVMKIAYPSGKVLAQYGSGYAGEGKVKGDGMFRGQHACRKLSDGHLVLFNNNTFIRTQKDSTAPAVSSVVIFKEPAKAGGNPELVWKYNCDIDTKASAYAYTGGIAYELSNTDLLVCAGDASRFFIVSRGKEVLWNAYITTGNMSQVLIAKPYRISPVEADRISGLLYRQ